MSSATAAIYRAKIWKIKATQYTSIKIHTYKLVMYLEMLHHFCSIHTPDDGPRLGRKYSGNN